MTYGIVKVTGGGFWVTRGETNPYQQRVEEFATLEQAQVHLVALLLRGDAVVAK